MDCLLLPAGALLLLNTPGEFVLFPVVKKSLNALTRFLRPYDSEKESGKNDPEATISEVSVSSSYSRREWQNFSDDCGNSAAHFGIGISCLNQ
jgi:hypothetical protein